LYVSKLMKAHATIATYLHCFTFWASSCVDGDASEIDCENENESGSKNDLYSQHRYTHIHNTNT